MKQKLKNALTAALLAALALLQPLGANANSPDFRCRPVLAGKALLTEPGFVVRRELGVASLAPELHVPIELVYKSNCEKSGVFGFAWLCPQLESSVKWSAGSLLWTTPWGEELRFCPKRQKTPKNAIALEPIEAAKKGRGLFSPYSDWESDTDSADYAKCRRFSIVGKNGMKGWRFEYADGRLSAITAPFGAAAEFVRDAQGRLLAVASQGVRFVELGYDADGLVASMRLNGVPTAFSYVREDRTILPKTADGRPRTERVAALRSAKTASLDAEEFAYANGYLALAKRGKWAEKFKVDSETPAERRQNLLSADAKNKVAHTGKVSGRLLADGDCSYFYPAKDAVEMRNALGEAARHECDMTRGTRTVRDFSGRTTKTYFFSRIDAAYHGKVRLVEGGVGGERSDLAEFRYDKKSGNPTIVKDRLGNSRYLEYDADGNCVKLTRRAAWEWTKEPVRSFAYDRQGRLAAVSELDADGVAARTTTLAYDRAGRPTRVSDGARTLAVSYAASGFPSEVRDDFASVAFAYDRYNRLVATTDPYGVVTRRTYADHGGIAKMERLDGREVLSSVAVAYDGSGRPVSVTDQDGRTTACDRDALGRVVRETDANGSDVAYAYDALGRLAKVVDENGHEIAFSWDAFGLSSRLTAAGQMTRTRRDGRGLAVETTASADGRDGRTVRREFDRHGRIVRVEYAKDEVETFAYDRWGRLSAHTRGKSKEVYRYDHFGRLVEKDEDGTVYTYAYDSYGRRVSRTIRFADGGEAMEERRSYDKYGRLVEIAAFGTSVKWRYDVKGRVSRQVVDGTTIDFAYTREGRLAGKYFGGRKAPMSVLEYEYSKDGRITARTANGVRQEYEYDGRGQLLAVKEGGADVERYVYDKAGNMARKTVRGKTTEFSFDGANQLVSSTTDGVTTRYAYDAVGRLVREGGKTYRYRYLDKVMSVADGERTYSYSYHVDGQLARADYGGGKAEDFLWDGLALARRGEVSFVNEPHVGGGAPVAASAGATFFNDLLGTTVGACRQSRYAANASTAFGESGSRRAFFTGKPEVEGLGYAFLFRNYRPDLAKWQTADPLGYPDGWNSLAYCNASPITYVDSRGGQVTCVYSITSKTFTMSDGDLQYVVRAISGDNIVAHQWDSLGPAPIGTWSIMNDPKDLYFQLWYNEDSCFDDVARKGDKRRQNIRLTVNSISHGCVCLDDNDTKSFNIIRYIKNTDYVLKRNDADNKLYRCFGILTVTE